MKYFTNCLPIAIAALLSLQSFAQDTTTPEIVDQWRYTLRRPADGWQQPEFDDSSWKEGFGGFGTRGTPGARIGTTWTTKNIWLRKSFELKVVPVKPALLMHHDEDVEVFINGQAVASAKGFIGSYKVFPIEPTNQSVLRLGSNTIAVRCKQTNGGQFIDVHVVDAEDIPKLPEPKRNTKPFESELITQWGAEVTADNAWTEYPRPLMQRAQWTNLNGHWDYAITTIDQTDKPADWNGKILVPYSLESKLGGVQRLLDPSEALWYHRTFVLKQKTAGKNWLLNFEAVDYRCEVFVNDISVGTHIGGNDQFSFDISDAIQPGENQLIVRVEDATEAYQLRGKQVINARGIWYTQVSGIWQTVWLEEVPVDHIEDLVIGTSSEDGSITVETVTECDKNIEVIVKDGGSTVATLKGSNQATIKLKDAKLWSPSSPHLYDITVNLLDDADQVIDTVDSYAGIRTVGKAQDADGHVRFTLNGETIFHWGPL
ncbi:MAG: sugar-binding domain-containing protein, partial [Planctomycetota bacterium]